MKKVKQKSTQYSGSAYVYKMEFLSRLTEDKFNQKSDDFKWMNLYWQDRYGPKLEYAPDSPSTFSLYLCSSKNNCSI